jgi:hypothetical protein
MTEDDSEPHTDDHLQPQFEDLATRAHRFISAFLYAVMTGEFIILLAERQWQSAAILLALFAIFLMPVVLNHRLKLVIPAEFQILVVLFAFAALFMGSIRGFYAAIWWWDLALHFCSGLLLGILGFLTIYVMNENERVQIYLRPKFAALFAFIFAVAVGALWEVFEFSVDQIFGYTMQTAMFGDPSGLTDTMWDLIVDALGAGSVSLLGWWYMSQHKRSLVEAMILKFIARNPQMFRR